MPEKSSFYQQQQKSQDKSHSFIGWGIFLLITLVFLLSKTFPTFLDWQTQRAKLGEFEYSIPKLEAQLTEKKASLAQKQEEFEKTASSYQIRESQIFPEEISVKEISKILELYSLQMSVVENFPFSIKSLSFGSTTEVLGKNYARTSVNMIFTGNERILKEFVRFLQFGEFSRKFEVIGNSGQLDPRAYNYLKENILPIAQIESINILEEATDGISGKLEVSLQFNLFSRVPQK